MINFIVIGFFFVLLLVGVLGGLGFGFWNVTPEQAEDDIATVEISGGKINVLLLGTDEGGLRTDCIMLASFDTETKEAKLLSIPRDTRMYVGTRYQKINAAHAVHNSQGEIAGAQGSVEAVSRLTGVPINYYVELPFNAVAECIDLLGPVTFEIPDLYNDGVGMVYDDPVQNLHINLKPGIQELNGEQVVHLLRYRKGNMVNGKRKSYENGDIGRIAVQQQFLQALIDQKLNASLILKMPAIFKQLTSSIKTNFNVKDIIKYSKYLTDFSSDMLHEYSLPGTAQDIDGASYWVCDLSETRVLIENEFGYDASNITIEKNAGAGTASSEKASGGGAKSSGKDTSSATGTATKKQDTNKSGTAVKTTDDSGKSKAGSDKTSNASGKATDKTEKKSDSKDSAKEAVSTKAPVKVDSQSDSKSKSKPSATKTPVKETSGDDEDERADE